MKLTEAKFWARYLKPAILKGFRIESATYNGIPDVFAVLHSGRPVWIENKVVSGGKDLLDYLRPGQREFRGDYSPFIPCVVIGVFQTLRTKALIADVYGQRLVVVGASWKHMTQKLLVDINKEIEKHGKRRYPKTNRTRKPCNGADPAENGPGVSA
jgi:hypothetical protein